MSEQKTPVRPEAVVIGDDAIPELANYCQNRDLNKLVIIADRNTYAALGQRVEADLLASGADLTSIVFDSKEVIADAHHVFDVEVTVDAQPRTYIAVGSGTITDITRFVSWRTGNTFVAVPTAPSVDGFASMGAPLIIHGVKTTLITHSPRAIFADLPTLTAAPRAMIAAGFGDMVGKFTSAADWKIGSLVWNEPFDEDIEERTIAAAKVVDSQAEAIGGGSPEAIRGLMEGLLDSGYTMLDLGSSRNASGAEHHYSHYWEMELLRQGRPAILHGAKVGVATVLVAKMYDQIKQLSRDGVANLLEASQLPSRKTEVARITDAYGEQAAPIIADQAPFLDLTEEDYDQLKRRILDNWDGILEAAAIVPSADQLRHSLELVGGPTDVAGLGLSAEEQMGAEQYGHYLRQRFTSRKLMRVLGLK